MPNCHRTFFVKILLFRNSVIDSLICRISGCNHITRSTKAYWWRVLGICGCCAREVFFDNAYDSLFLPCQMPKSNKCKEAKTRNHLTNAIIQAVMEKPRTSKQIRARVAVILDSDQRPLRTIRSSLYKLIDRGLLRRIDLIYYPVIENLKTLPPTQIKQELLLKHLHL